MQNKEHCLQMVLLTWWDTQHLQPARPSLSIWRMQHKEHSLQGVFRPDGIPAQAASKGAFDLGIC